MKKAILVASFGSTHIDTLENCVYPMERAIAGAFPEHKFYRAFLSNIVRKRLAENKNMIVPDVTHAMEEIVKEGMEEVLVQPTLMIPGEEYDRCLAQLEPFSDKIKIKVGKPLFSDEKDMDEIIAILEKTYPMAEDEVLLVMGHGTEHSANSIYETLAEKMRSHKSIRLCTVEGTPTFEDGVAELKSMNVKRATLIPLMLVAGDHAKNDMAGDGEDSLASMIQAEGIETTCVINGLGSMEEVQKLFRIRANEAEK